jgi:hypothetical protein
VKDQPQIEVTELQKRNPAAWTVLLQAEPLLTDEVVTAVSAELLYSSSEPFDSHVTRYVLSLENCSDPISFISKKSNRVELIFYRDLAKLIPGLAPRCWFTHLEGETGWLVLDDVPNFHLPPTWSAKDVEMIINELSRLHAAAWQQNSRLQRSGLNHFIGQKKYTLADLQQENELYFEEGPAAIISQHAIDSAGELAPVLLKAANGLTVIRSLDGWPGILGESHITAVADLLDDPLPMLQPLKELPVTLIHGNPFSYHWRLTCLDQRRLIDWQQAMIGPGICDLVSFIEQFDMIYEDNGRWPIQLRPEWPVTEETMIDSYLLSLSSQLGEGFDARATRLAIPAARCLQVVTNWFPYFANWFSDMPNKYTWQKVNRMSDDQLMGTVFQPIIGFRPYLARIFQRFLQAYRKL